MNYLTVPESDISWERLDGESTKAYGAFCIYMRLPPNGKILERRSLRNAVIKLYGNWTSSKQRQMQAWSAKWRWVARATSWDDELESQVNFDALDNIRKLNDRQVQLGQAIQQKAIERLKSIQPIEMTVGDVINFITTGVRLERQALGEPDIVEKNITELDIVDFTRLSTEELRTLLSRKITIPASISSVIEP